MNNLNTNLTALMGQIFDSDLAPVSNVIISVNSNQYFSDNNGMYSIPVSIQDKDKTVTFSKSGFSNINRSIRSISEDPVVVLPINSAVKTITLSARVINQDFQPLENANVSIVGTSRGTITNSDGFFTLGDVNLDDLIFIGYAGLQSVEEIASEINGEEVILFTEVLDPVIIEAPKKKSNGLAWLLALLGVGGIIAVSSNKDGQLGKPKPPKKKKKQVVEL
ncbi:MAG: hypothetical protein HRT68_10220 [Flavobacteriaceae bacterium]|nr:hypothetical protein [Flavobacteriaceae bacterium]